MIKHIVIVFTIPLKNLFFLGLSEGDRAGKHNKMLCQAARIYNTPKKNPHVSQALSSLEGVSSTVGTPKLSMKSSLNISCGRSRRTFASCAVSSSLLSGGT